MKLGPVTEQAWRRRSRRPRALFWGELPSLRQELVECLALRCLLVLFIYLSMGYATMSHASSGFPTPKFVAMSVYCPAHRT